MTDNKDFTKFSRRGFLVGTGGLVLASALPTKFASAQTAPTYTRYNVSSDEGLAMLDSYKIAITEMLNRPPCDPHNWYRNALVHTLDCPHGNWWFLPWHRGYMGWFEKTCRQLSCNSNFAFPYWDWTEEPYLPDVFFDGVLDPSNEAFIQSYDVFMRDFKNPMSQFWDSLSQEQLDQLRYREYNSFDDFWAYVERIFPPPGYFRGLTRGNSGFDEETQTAVSEDTILEALSDKYFAGFNNTSDDDELKYKFVGFGSGPADHHGMMVSQGIIEAQPHNLVHNIVGGIFEDNTAGFMTEFLSPVDPIFFMHHSNMDRLWDVWTRKQESFGLPTLPIGSRLDKWREEPFLFFIDDNGNPLLNGKAQDYEVIGDFDYGYTPGSGESIIPKRKSKGKVSRSVKVFRSAVTAASALNFTQLSTRNINLPYTDFRAAVAEAATSHVAAEITIQPPANVRGVSFNVLVNPPKGARNIGFDSPHFAGAFQFFGTHRHSGPITFTIPLTKALKALAKNNKLGIDMCEPLEIAVVPNTKGITINSLEAALESVTIKIF
ncbi:MAG: tyrosinase family protein [Symploca sp. SIO2C1]|nr:tyrosinase family protein [Symploca sp. SIO2C1]